MDITAEGSPEYNSVLSAALQGDVNAQFELARIMEEEQDQPQLACGWFKKAALQGHVYAAYRAGLICFRATDDTQVDSAFWFNKAANAGHADAQYHLGLVCERGIGVPMDPDAALRWFRTAAQNGSSEAKKRIDEMSDWLDQISDSGTFRKQRNSIA